MRVGNYDVAVTGVGRSWRGHFGLGLGHSGCLEKQTQVGVDVGVWGELSGKDPGGGARSG